MKLKCQCCGIEQEFTDEEDAFIKGWDCPPHFSQYVSCSLCPGSCIVLHLPHTKAHALWLKEGRPLEFSLAKCAADHNFDQFNN